MSLNLRRLVDKMRAARRLGSWLLSPQRNPSKEGRIMATWKSSTVVVPLPIKPGLRFARVPDWPDYAAASNGFIWSSKTGEWRRLIGKIDRAGRPAVTLRHRGKQKAPIVAVLVLAAFRGSAPAGMECCHSDGDPINNRLSNLRWDTRSNNHRDAVCHGTHTGCRRGEAHAATTIPFETVCAIRATNGKPSYAAVARQFAISYTSVRNFVLRLRRRDL